MKRKLFLLSVSVLTAVLCFGQSGTCGANLTWTLSDGTLTISGTGAMTNYYYSTYASWYSYRNSITTVIMGNGVTSIGDYAFYQCSGLTSVIIPESVTSIRDYAFYQCSGLTSITIPNSVTSIGSYAFSICTRLTSITIPNSVTTIGNSAFFNCTGLTSITIPESVKTIGDDTFSDCTGLTSVTIPESVTSIGSSAFRGCTGLTSVTIGNSVRSIGMSAFSGCTGLTSVTIGNSVGSIGMSAFSGCTGLTSITIPNSVTSIGSSTFSGCTGLTSVYIPESVTSIGYNVFANCSNLTELTLPFIGSSASATGNNAILGYLFGTTSNSAMQATTQYYASSSSSTYYLPKNLKKIIVTFPCSSISYGTFYDCIMLKEVVLPSSIKTIGSYAFHDCTGLTSITIPNSVTSIGSYAFQGCIRLTSIEVNNLNLFYSSENGVLFDKQKTKLICYPAGKYGSYTVPNSVTTIGDAAFYVCSLTSIVIPNSVTSIGSSTFYSCTGLTSIVIPNSVTSIGTSAFYGCTGLTSINIPVNVTSIESSTFYGCTGLNSIIIPVTVTSIGNSAFQGSGLTSVDISSSVTNIGTDAFRNCAKLKKVLAKNSSLSTSIFSGCPLDTLIVWRITGSLNFPLKQFALLDPTIGSLPSGLLSGCSRLTDLTLPFIGISPTATGENAVLGALFSTSTATDAITQYYEDGKSKKYAIPKTLQKLTLTRACTQIGYGALYNCNMLKEVTVASTVRGIGEKALYGCSGLDHIYSQWANPPSAYNNSTFEGVNKYACTVHVPIGSKGKYSSADGWKEFYIDNIQEEAAVTIATRAVPLYGGIIEGTVQYNYDATAQLTASGNMGYDFKCWMEDQTVVSTDRIYSFTVTAPRTLYAVFTPRENADENIQIQAQAQSASISWIAVKDAENYLLIIYSDASRSQEIARFNLDVNGNVLRADSRNLSCTVPNLDSATEYYYSLTSYDKDSQALTMSDGSFSTTEETPFEITAIPVPLYGGVIEGELQYHNGEVTQLTASSNAAYDFKSWMEDQTEVSADRTYSFTVTAPRTLYAVFTPRENGDENIQIQAKDKTAIVSWIALDDATNYQLIIYSDANRSVEIARFNLDVNGNVLRNIARNLSCTVENLNPITEYHYLLTSYNNDNKALTVSAGNFVTTDDVGIDNPLLVNGIWIYPNPASESFRIGGITGETQVTITDVSGKTLIKRTVAPNEAVSIQHLPKGVYTVRAGETVIRLIRK